MKMWFKLIVFLLVIFLIVVIYYVNSKSQVKNTMEETVLHTNNEVPDHLLKLFPKTDFSKSEPNLKNSISGGPTKDGIPAIDNPKFISVSEAEYPDQIQAIILKGKTQTKVYPYSILTWHEIVNDTIDDIPVAVTFCPLCGSAIVYDRTLPDGTVSTFGVSGSLLESNMIMYDRKTENLWQQSTGETLAGSFYPATLSLVPMQLLTMKEVKEKFSNALVLSTETGYIRNYDFSPYAGYESSDQFIFDPGNIDNTLPQKPSW